MSRLVPLEDADSKNIKKKLASTAQDDIWRVIKRKIEYGSNLISQCIIYGKYRLVRDGSYSMEKLISIFFLSGPMRKYARVVCLKIVPGMSYLSITRMQNTAAQ